MNGSISNFRMDYGFDAAALVLGALLFVISSEARNLSLKTKISQAPLLASFEPGAFEMTRADLS
ncbi:MAG: hypothetical protein ACP5M0_14270 [Desulfomonilaceae bacterium]